MRKHLPLCDQCRTNAPSRERLGVSWGSLGGPTQHKESFSAFGGLFIPRLVRVSAVMFIGPCYITGSQDSSERGALVPCTSRPPISAGQGVGKGCVGLREVPWWGSPETMLHWGAPLVEAYRAGVTHGRVIEWGTGPHPTVLPVGPGAVSGAGAPNLGFRPWSVQGPVPQRGNGVSFQPLPFHACVTWEPPPLQTAFSLKQTWNPWAWLEHRILSKWCHIRKCHLGNEKIPVREPFASRQFVNFSKSSISPFPKLSISSHWN